jgi:3-keto-disaccharide hydrolase
MAYTSQLNGLVALVIATLLAASGVGGDAGGWKHLFNGKDLSGWEHVGPGAFTVENGMLKTEGGMGLLWYKTEPLGNVRIQVVYRNPGGANSGVFIRIPERPTEPWMPVYRGYEVQIYDKSDADEYHCTGALESLTRAMAKPAHPEEWNTMEITLDGDHTMVSINGVLVTDYREGQPVPPKKERWEPDRGTRPVVGYIGLQNYGPDDVVYFRDVSIQALRRQGALPN